MTTKAKKTESLAESLATLIAKAPALRAAGVLQVSTPELSAVLAPADPAPSSPPKASKAIPNYPNALDDPAAYPGGRVPGYQRED